MKRLSLILAVLMIAAALLSACGASVATLWCPINYTTVKESCRAGGNNPDQLTWEAQPALRLDQNQVGVFSPPGDAAPRVVRDIASNDVPAKYTKVFPNVRVTYRTIGSPIDASGKFQGCTDFENANKLCATPLDQVRLKGGVEASVDYEIDIEVVVNDQTAPQLAKLQYGFADLVKSLDGYSRTEFRRANEIDPASYTDGSMDGLLQAKYASLMSNWEYVKNGVVKIDDVRVRKTEVAGYTAQATDIKSQQGLEQAKAYATMEATACGSYTQEAYKSYCMAVFIWSQKGDGSAMPQPPAGYPALPAPAPSTAP